MTNQLKVLILNKTYTLNPSREYVLGSGEDCDIPLVLSDDGATEYLKFIFNHEENVWYAYELSRIVCMTVNGQHMTICPIKDKIKISIVNNILITAVPEGQSGIVGTSTNTDFTNTYSSSFMGNQQNTLLASRDSELTIPTINLGLSWFKISSPIDGVGIWLHRFDLYQTYSVEREHLSNLCEKLYIRVHQAVVKGTLKDAKVRFLKFNKRKFMQEDTRKYLLVTRDTIHGNRTTVFLRFLEYGDNLYIGIDVFSLGRINWLTFLGRVLLSLILFPFIWAIIPAMLIALLWWKIIWRMNYEKRIWLALRQEHPGKIGIGPFDLDDVMMFSKSTLHLAVMEIRNVFEEEDLPIECLDHFIQQINNYGDNYSVSSGGGSLSMTNSAIGAGNKVM